MNGDECGVYIALLLYLRLTTPQNVSLIRTLMTIYWLSLVILFKQNILDLPWILTPWTWSILPLCHQADVLVGNFSILSSKQNLVPDSCAQRRMGWMPGQFVVHSSFASPEQWMRTRPLTISSDSFLPETLILLTARLRRSSTSQNTIPLFVQPVLVSYLVFVGTTFDVWTGNCN